MEMQGAYLVCRERWKVGERDRELALQLMFLTWMHWADPPFVTGLRGDPDALDLWRETFGWLGAEASSDAEFLAVSGVMITVTPWAFGDATEWQAKAAFLTSRVQELPPSGMSESTF